MGSNRCARDRVAAVLLRRARAPTRTVTNANVTAKQMSAGRRGVVCEALLFLFFADANGCATRTQSPRPLRAHLALSEATTFAVYEQRPATAIDNARLGGHTLHATPSRAKNSELVETKNRPPTMAPITVVVTTRSGKKLADISIDSAVRVRRDRRRVAGAKRGIKLRALPVQTRS